MSVPVIAVRWWDGSQMLQADLTVTLMVGTTDYSARVSGQLKITAEEESARLANFSITPMSSAEMDALDGAAVTIDIKVDDGVTPVTYRRFTGAVASWSYNAGQRLISITARDKYQETIKGCTSAAAVETLIGGHATISTKLATWSSDKPNPTSYFNALLATVQGSYYVNGSGVWSYMPWTIATTPAASFTAGDVFDDSLSIEGAEKSGLPSSINAKLTIRIPRLWSASVNLNWTGLDYISVGRGRGNWSSVESIQSALSSADGWYVKGNPEFIHPNRSYVIPLLGGGTAAMSVSNPESIATGFSAEMYCRWYQEVDVIYRFNLDLGGSSDADESISESFSSNFDASNWEKSKSSETPVNIYAWNAPETTNIVTGYEGLPEPWPPKNGSIFHFPDISSSEIINSVNYVVAKAVRSAAEGLRKKRVTFDAKINPSFEIGNTVSINFNGVNAIGQLVNISYVIDFEISSAYSTYVISCPDGNGEQSGFYVDVNFPTSTKNISIESPVLKNFVGSDVETDLDIDINSIIGSLSNTYVNVTGYSPTAPGYVQQFRVLLPEIGEIYRNPESMNIDLNVEYNISSGFMSIEL